MKPVDINRLMADSESSNGDITDAFISEHRPLVEGIARKIATQRSLPLGIEFGDVLSWGMEGLMKARRQYRADKGSSFKTYAFYRIRGEIYDHIRSEWQYRNPTDMQEQHKKIQDRIADMVEESLLNGDIDAVNFDDKITSMIQESVIVCLMSLDSIQDLDAVYDTSSAVDEVPYQDSPVWEEVKKLEPLEQTFVELFYVKDLNQKEISDALQLSRSSVSRLHSRILVKLKRRMERGQKNEAPV